MTAATWRRATQLVDDEGSERFAFDVLSHDQERLAALRDLLQQGQQVFHRADFLFVDQDVSVLERNFHALGIGHKVRREIPTIKLHALDNIQLGLKRLGFFNGDDAILAHLLHSLGNNVPNSFVVVGADCADLGDHVAGDGLGEFVQLALDAVAFFVEAAANGGDGLLDAAFHGHRVGAGCDGLYAFAVDRLGQNGGGGGAVAGNIRGLRGHFAHHLRAHVFERVFKFDFLRDGDAVLGDGRGTEFLFDDDVAALGAESDFYRVSQ